MQNQEGEATMGRQEEMTRRRTDLEGERKRTSQDGIKILQGNNMKEGAKHKQNAEPRGGSNDGEAGRND
ncbi:hypothetical protein QE152_g31020 [Popillia japonica]|uniref:Uncharacterized protein n=1 Tax=Popillia japonica TaxID=7064 RepID=A0AAW1JCJ2_POPJA